MWYQKRKSSLHHGSERIQVIIYVTTKLTVMLVEGPFTHISATSGLCLLSASVSVKKEKYIVTLNSVETFIHIWHSIVFWKCHFHLCSVKERYHGCWTSVVTSSTKMHVESIIKLAWNQRWVWYWKISSAVHGTEVVVVKIKKILHCLCWLCKQRKYA